MSRALCLVYASIYIFRAYFSIPDNFYSKSGEVVNAVYGYTHFLLDLLECKPTYISVAFDKSLNRCFRNEIYPAYKANRALPDGNLSFQLSKCEEITQLLGIHSLSFERYEADDIIGTLHKKFSLPKIIVTRDKDLGQLIGPEDVLWDFANDSYSSVGDIKDKLGVWPKQIPDYLALAGDAVDNIPGAPGIGTKTAIALLAKFGSITQLYASLDQIFDIDLRGAKKVHSILVNHRSEIMLYRKITNIFCDIPINITLNNLRFSPVSNEKVLAFCDEMILPAKLKKRVERLT